MTSAELDERRVTMWFTTMCQACDNAMLVTDGRSEWCDWCGEKHPYKPKAERDPKGEGRRDKGAND